MKKSNRERQKLFDIACMWKLKKNKNTANIYIYSEYKHSKYIYMHIYSEYNKKKKQTHRYREQWREGRGGRAIKGHGIFKNGYYEMVWNHVQRTIENCVSRSVMPDSLWPHGLYMSSPGKKTGVDCHSLPRGSSQPRDRTQFPASQSVSLHLCHQEAPKIIKHYTIQRIFHSMKKKEKKVLQ